ncbi:hypothetical protein Mapa_009651 [Marchantia paleacea]|nr:hypothetical protein Mapa_009651 [Marchantia paleacea]
MDGSVCACQSLGSSHNGQLLDWKVLAIGTKVPYSAQVDLGISEGSSLLTDVIEVDGGNLLNLSGSEVDEQAAGKAVKL